MDGILMVEGGGQEASEELMLEAVALAHAEIKKICALQLELQKQAGKPKSKVAPIPYPEGFKEAVAAQVTSGIETILKAFPKKEVRDVQLRDLKHAATAALLEKYPASEILAELQFEECLYNTSRRLLLDTKFRADGRNYDQIRVITGQVPFLPRTHGSALFTRGQTQALATVTLGTPQDMQIMDELEGEYKERFMLHYNFPGWSVGEVKPERGQSRREIGHGALAKRALYALLPDNDTFPYTLRIVSDILESNGSSSMASICGGSLAMFDAGVPLKAACAGIAMGLIYEGGKYAVISDIMGFEDHLGDMDFKVAGSANGITAFQMDLKVEGISLDIMKEALMQAKAGRLHILGKMNEILDKPRADLSPYAPRLFKVVIPQDKIGALIGPGGKNIRRIQEETGAEVEVEDDGSVFISGLDAAKVQAAKEMVEFVTAEAEIGKIYKGKVVSIKEFGAFVEIFPGREGLCHISQLDVKRIARVEDAVKEGDTIEVKVLEIDNMGKIRLSRKAVLAPGTEFEGDQGRRPPSSGPGGDRGRGPRPAGRR
jgi:polyribonucleotide nucleotidyltransferase